MDTFHTPSVTITDGWFDRIISPQLCNKNILVLDKTKEQIFKLNFLAFYTRNKLSQ